ncbi:MAG: hypothetical protein ACNA8R_15730, partial [Nitriliruptoraceae bacterium]
GEADGPASIADALDHGAERLGHGIRVIEDVADDGTLGPVARRVHDQEIALEVCPTSNVHTGVSPDVATHPIGRLLDLGFRVTLSTDNRLMSGVTATSELAAVVDAFDLGLDDLEELATTAAAAAYRAQARSSFRRRTRCSSPSRSPVSTSRNGPSGIKQPVASANACSRSAGSARSTATNITSSRLN